MRPILVALCLTILTPALRAQQPAAPTAVLPQPVAGQGPVTVGAPVVIDRVGSGQRAVILPDAVAAALVAGTWQVPKAGDEVRLPDGAVRTWQAATLDATGLLMREASGDGYAAIPIDAVADEIAVLQITGHGVAYLNGEPRTGDPYATGWAKLPVLLRQGRNDLLIRTARGREARVRLHRPIAPVFIDIADPTLPDLVEGQSGRMLGGLVVVNASPEWQRGWYFTARVHGGPRHATPIDPLPPFSTRKVAFEFDVPADIVGPKVRLDTGLARSPEPSAPTPFTALVMLEARKPEQRRKITFKSGIDGSAQYYALQPALRGAGVADSLILTLHGAGVEAAGQADAYQPKSWANIVAPTNRRPYGFDWEDWGRLDAMEVLDLATAALKPDPARVYLTGHSMGGHGTWQIGAHLAPRFAAIAPSAGWITFRTYAGAASYDGGTPGEEILKRATSPSDTLALKDNYRPLGVYVLHGDADDNVPVAQARTMRQTLGEFHSDFSYYERPGAGHWWGNECVDWPPLMTFLRDRTRQPAWTVRFTTASPGVSAACAWVTIEQQTEQLKPSGVDLRLSVKRDEVTGAGGTGPPGVVVAGCTITGTTLNVSIMSLDLGIIVGMLPPDKDGAAVDRSLAINLDGREVATLPLRSTPPRVWLGRDDDSWNVIAAPAPVVKNAHRSGLFKNAFTNNVLLVAGTAGTPEENAWCLAKARYDAETFWYRGNGSLPIVLDTEFDPDAEPERNVILYGNADSNGAWRRLIGDSPIQVAGGRLGVGERSFAGRDLACLFIRPRPGSDRACVGAVSGSGLAGMRLASQIPYFRSGVGLPDWIVVGPEALQEGAKGIRGAGFFGNDWRLSEPDSGWAPTPE